LIENREWAMNEIDSGDTKRIVNGLLSLAFYDDDWEYVEGLCIQLSNHIDDNVSGIAILCFGHLARLHRKLHLTNVMPIIDKALLSNHSFIRGNAENAKDDIEVFIINKNS
jgi:hypothetical protein